MGISDRIEAFIMELMKDDYAEFGRNELADIFGCEMVDLMKENAVFPQAEQLRSREEELKAAFFGGYADDLTKDEIDELWSDARDYLTYKIAQRRKRKE